MMRQKILPLRIPGGLARIRTLRYAIECVFCVTPDVQVVDTCINQPFKKALAKEQEKWEMATAGDPKNAGRGWARAPRGGNFAARVHGVYRGARVYRRCDGIRAMRNYAPNRWVARSRARLRL